MSARSKKKELPFINGWASPTRYTAHRHAIVSPGDLGSRAPALCGIKPVLGWVEPDLEERHLHRCHTCLVLFRQMYEDSDLRLTPADRSSWRRIEAELNAQHTSPNTQGETSS